MIKYKIDVLQELKNAGYSTYKLRQNRILGEATIQKLRDKELVSWDNINTVCGLLHCSIGDIVEHKPDIIEITEDERYGMMIRRIGDAWKIDGIEKPFPNSQEAEKAAKRISSER